MDTKKQVIDYLRSYVLDIGFQELYDFVIKKKNCILCGACASLCPRIELRENGPALLEYDPQCSTCFRYCARTFFPEGIFEKEVFGNDIRKDELLGNYCKIFTAKSLNDSVLKFAQNGGIVSTLLIHALKERLVDGVLLIDKDKRWRPKPVIARTTKDILSFAGSKYTMAPSLLPYGAAVSKYKLKKLAFVGMPCQIKAVRKFQIHPPLSEEFGKFHLIIGLYCSSNFSYDLMKDYIQGKLGIPLISIIKFDISRGKLIIKTRDKLIKEIPIKELSSYKWASCQYCKDYTAEFADISIGSVGAPSDDWNSVILRTKIGKQVFESARLTNQITVLENVDVAKIKKLSLKKKLQITQINQKMLSAMNFLDITGFEAKIYITLLSLGSVELIYLKKVLKEDNSKINKALLRLKKRGWVMNSNDFYYPVNPSQVIKEEIFKIKRKMEQNIKKLESDALIDLKTLFVQNNFTRVKYKELIELI